MLPAADHETTAHDCIIPPRARADARYNAMKANRTGLRVTRKDGKVTITLEAAEYEKLVDDLDELDAIRAYDAAKKSGETPILFKKAPDCSRK
jgi:hypothetical protein